MKASSPPRASSDQLRAFGPVRFLLLGGIAALAVLLKPHAAFADPHAVFYTTKGQEQLFYNVLAALNQADFVEPPTTGSTGPGELVSVRAQGDAIARGQPTDAFGTPAAIQGYAEPNERVLLPRIRVRSVTSDNGDVYYRELSYRKALSEMIRTEFSEFSCEIQRQIYGDEVCPKPSTSGQRGATPTGDEYGG